MNFLAAIFVAAAMLAGMPDPPRHRLARLEPSPDVRASRWRWRWLGWPLAVVGPTACGWLTVGESGAAIGFSVGLVAATWWTVWRDQRAHSQARLRSESVTNSCVELAGLVRVGHVPAVALRIAAADSPVLAEAAAVQEVGGQVPAALRRLGASPGGSGLGELATAWEVSARTGASLTATLDALADRLDASRKLRRMVDSELSSSRATSRMLAALPLAGLALGFACGGDPLAFLLGTSLGQAALCLAVTLACTGVWWTERIAKSAGG